MYDRKELLCDNRGEGGPAPNAKIAGGLGGIAVLSDYPWQLIDGDYLRMRRLEGGSTGDQFELPYGLVGRVGGMKKSGLKAANSSLPKAYSIGIYKYVSVKGAEQTVRHYTCSRAKAVAYIGTLQLQGAP